jgi:hypothetical protein
MAAKPITLRFKNRAALQEFMHELIDTGVPDNTKEFIDLAKLYSGAKLTLEQQLDKWLHDNTTEVCDKGRKKILAGAKKYTSWKQYLKAHWDDDDGVRGWASSRIINYISSWELSFTSFEDVEFRDGVKWPFKRTTRRR